MISGLVSILLPSAHRPRELERCLNSILSSQYGNIQTELLMSIMGDDPDSLSVARKLSLEPVWIRTNDDYGMGQLWAFNELFKRSQGEYIVIAADDLVMNPDWLIEAMSAMKSLPGPGLVAFNDLHSDGNLYAAHFLVARQFLTDRCGGRLFPPHYKVWWVDRELSDIAQAAGLYVWAKKSIVEHRHWNWHLAQIDQTYQDAIPFHAVDEKVYLSRKKSGFPVDW